MLEVSNKYKQAIKEPIRQFNFLSRLCVGNKQDNFNVNTIFENAADISNGSSLNDGTPISYKYASLDRDSFLLDGSFILPNQSNNKYVGFISDTPEESSLMLWAMSYSVFYKDKMTICFENGYAKNFTITTYFGGALLSLDPFEYVGGTTTETTYTNEKEIITVDLPYYNNSYDKVVKITINEWSNANHKARISKVLNGEQLIFKNNDIIDTNLLEETDLLGITTPSNHFSITLNNYDRRFNILDKNNILNKLNGSSFISNYVGLNIDGAYEYVYLGGYKYSSYTENENKTTRLDFDGIMSNISTLIGSYYYGNSPVSISWASNNILGTGDTTKIKYQGYFPMQYTDISTKIDQVVAFSTFYNAMIKESRGLFAGTVGDGLGLNSLMGASIDDEVKTTIYLTNQTRNPKFTKYIKTKTISFKIKSTTKLKEERTEIYNDKLEVQEYGSYMSGTAKVFSENPVDMSTIDMYCGETKIMENGVPISGSISYIDMNMEGNYYNIYYTIRSENSGIFDYNFRILAREYEVDSTPVQLENTNIEQGASLEINNNYIRDIGARMRIGQYIFKNEKDYEFETEILGDPSLEVGDTILLESTDGFHKAVVSKIETKYNGGFIQTIKGVSTGVLQ